MIAAELVALTAIAKVLASSEAPPLALDPIVVRQDDERPHVHNSAVPA
jgi:hypothetical protein